MTLPTSPNPGFDLRGLEFNTTAAARPMRSGAIANVAAFDAAFGNDDSQHDQGGAVPDTGAAGFGDAPAPGPNTAPETPPVAPVPLVPARLPQQPPPGSPASPMQPAPPPTQELPVPQLPVQPSTPALPPPPDQATEWSASSSTTTNGPTGSVKPDSPLATVDSGTSGSSHETAGGPVSKGGASSTSFFHSSFHSGSSSGISISSFQVGDAGVFVVAGGAVSLLVRSATSSNSRPGFGGATGQHDSSDQPADDDIGLPSGDDLIDPKAPRPAHPAAPENPPTENQDVRADWNLARTEMLGCVALGKSLQNEINRLGVVIQHSTEAVESIKAEVEAEVDWSHRMAEEFTPLKDSNEIDQRTLSRYISDIQVAQRLAHYAQQSIFEAVSASNEAMVAAHRSLDKDEQARQRGIVVHQTRIISEQQDLYNEQTAEIVRLRGNAAELIKTIRRDNETIERFVEEAQARIPLLDEQAARIDQLDADRAAAWHLRSQKIAELIKAQADLRTAELAFEEAEAALDEANPVIWHLPPHHATSITTASTTLPAAESNVEHGAHGVAPVEDRPDLPQLRAAVQGWLRSTDFIGVEPDGFDFAAHVNPALPAALQLMLRPLHGATHTTTTSSATLALEHEIVVVGSADFALAS